MSKRSSKAFWERSSAFYDRALRADAAIYEEVAGYARPYITEEKEVLELACGTGLITERVAMRARFYEATDYSAAMCERARDAVPSGNVHFSVQDAAALPYAEESFDIVICVNALHVMSDPDKVMEEIRRVLRPDGVLIAPHFVRSKERRAKLRALLAGMAGLTAYRNWDIREFLSFLDSHGFSPIEQHVIENGIRDPIAFVSAVKQNEE